MVLLFITLFCLIIFSGNNAIYAQSLLDNILDWAIENAGMDSDSEETDAVKEYAKDFINPNKDSDPSKIVDIIMKNSNAQEESTQRVETSTYIDFSAFSEENTTGKNCISYGGYGYNKNFYYVNSLRILHQGFKFICKF